MKYSEIELAEMYSADRKTETQERSTGRTQVMTEAVTTGLEEVKNRIQLDGFDMEKLVHFLDNYPGTFFLKDAEGRYTYASQQCVHVNPGLIGKNELEAQKDPALGREYYAQDQKLLREGGSVKCYSEVKIPAAPSLWLEINKSAVAIDGQIVGIIGTVADVTHEIELQQQLNRMLETDPVTGVYNRGFMKMWLEKAEQNIRYPFSLIACDCNFLKHVNDTFGHERGDQLLKSAGDLFQQNLPTSCLSIRTGGDEFLLLCNETTEEEAEALIARLQEKAKGVMIEDVPLSIAYGCATIESSEKKSFEQCKEEADKRMYAAKRAMKEAYLNENGRFDPNFNESFLRSLMREMPVLAFFKDRECRYRYISLYHEEHLKNKDETNYGIGCTDLELQRDEKLGKKYYEDDLKILKTGRGSVLRVRCPGEGGKPHNYIIIKSAYRDEEKNIIGIIGNVIDVTATRLDFENIAQESIEGSSITE